MDLYSSFNNQANQILEPLNDPTIRTFLMIFLATCGGLAAPSIAKAKYAWIFDKTIFRVAFLTMLLWIGNHDPGVSLGVAMVFLAVMTSLSGKSLSFEMFEGPATAIYPGCMNMTVFDLLESFKNDKEALMNAMLVSRVPGDVKVTDYYAPLIATYLLSRGFTLKSPCTPPGVETRVGAWSV